MRLFCRNGTYYVEFPYEKKRSLRTKDKREAQRLFKELKEEYIRGELHLLKDSETLIISDFIDRYIQHPDRKDLSPQTHIIDKISFKKFADAVGDIDLSTIKLDHITKFKSVIQPNLKPISVNTYLKHIKVGLNFAVAQGWLDSSTIPKINYLKLPNKLVRVISPEHIKLILDEAKTSNYEMYKIIMFALYTGCRRTELMKLCYEDIDYNKWLIKIHGKGNKDRMIPLLPTIREFLETGNTGVIFTKYKHKATISREFHKITLTCKISARFHDLRHTAATQMLTSNIPLDVVQKMLGHSAISTTQIYAQVVAERLQQEMGKLAY